MTVNQRISEYLSKTGWTQATLAEAIGTTRPYLSRLLKSDDIKLSQLLKICDALKVPPYFFFDVVNPELEAAKKRISELEELIAYKSLKLEQKEKYDVPKIKQEVEIVLNEKYKGLNEKERMAVISSVNEAIENGNKHGISFWTYDLRTSGGINALIDQALTWLRFTEKPLSLKPGKSYAIKEQKKKSKKTKK